jgi:hypothetical protein
MPKMLKVQYFLNKCNIYYIHLVLSLFVNLNYLVGKSPDIPSRFIQFASV